MDDGVNDVEGASDGGCGCVGGSNVVVVWPRLDEKKDLVISKGKEAERKLSSGMQSLASAAAGQLGAGVLRAWSVLSGPSAVRGGAGCVVRVSLARVAGCRGLRMLARWWW